MEEGRSWRGSYYNICETLQPYLLSIFAEVCYAGNSIVVKNALNEGMSPYVLIVYSHAIATLITALLAAVVERNNRPAIKLAIFPRIFILGILGPILGRTIYYAGLEYTSAVFAAAMYNLFPTLTFLLAIICRMEQLELEKIASQAKVVGIFVAVGGAILMTLYKGNIVIYPLSRHSSTLRNSVGSVDKDWIKGSIMVIASAFALAGYFVLQASTLKRYPAPVSLTSLTNLMGTIQAAILMVIVERQGTAWWSGWDITLRASAYSGIIAFGLGTYAQLFVIRKRGPVFVTAFSPLGVVMVALTGLLILGESVYLGGVIGAVFIVIGLYLVLWGKKKENNMKAAEIESCHQPLINDHHQRETENAVI